jgi:hypothetical protein
VLGLLWVALNPNRTHAKAAVESKKESFASAGG